MKQEVLWAEGTVVAGGTELQAGAISQGPRLVNWRQECRAQSRGSCRWLPPTRELRAPPPQHAGLPTCSIYRL